jgi:hypothetical protein
MAEEQKQRETITRKAFLTAMMITWLYMLLLVGRLLATDGSGPNRLLFIGALGAVGIYVAQLFAVLAMRRQ